MYSIKRLFYLSTSKKIQYFKKFILPYFDYCLWLLDYFPKRTIHTHSNCFDTCLYKLLKFKIESNESSDQNETDIIIFNDKLQKYGLFTFQHLLMNKMLLFIHDIINNPLSP